MNKSLSPPRTGSEIFNFIVHCHCGVLFPFFSLERKEPKVQGLHSSSYKWRHSAEISENSRFALKHRDFFTLHAPICFTPLPLGRS